MTLSYHGEQYELSEGEIRFPTADGESMWVEIRWLCADGRRFTFTIEKFPGVTEADVLGVHQFRCANDCDAEWDREHLIGTYDGVHANLYNGHIDIARSSNGIRIKVSGLIADSMDDIEIGDGYKLEFEEIISEMT